MTDQPDTPDTEPEPTLTDLSFRLGEQFGRIGAKLDRLLEASGIDPDSPEVAAAVQAAQAGNTAVTDQVTDTKENNS